jgi:hypothetical protein
MNLQLENIRKSRLYIIDFVKDLSLEKLNKIPHGFNNNIMWNLGHLVAAQQSICYSKGGLTPSLSEHDYAKYKPGTRPERFYDSIEEDEVKSLLISAIDVMQRDYEQGLFQAFVPWTNRYGNSLSNIDEAINYLQFHEGLHFGVITSIRKLVSKA